MYVSTTSTLSVLSLYRKIHLFFQPSQLHLYIRYTRAQAMLYLVGLQLIWLTYVFSQEVPIV